MKAITDYKATSDEELILLYNNSDAKVFSKVFSKVRVAVPDLYLQTHPEHR